MPGASPTDVPVRPVYYEALERQLETLRFMKQRKPYSAIARAFGRKHDRHLPGLTDHHDEMDTAVAAGLEHAVPHFWTGHMCDLLHATAADLPAWTLRQEDMAASAGYLWFQHPLPILEGVNGVADREHLRAMLWCAVGRSAPGAAVGRRFADPGYMVIPFTVFPDGPVTRTSEADLGPPAIDVAHGTPRTPLMWYLGQSLDGFYQGLETLYRQPDFRSSIRQIAGMPATFHMQQMMRFGQYFAAAVALMNQTLVRIAPYRGDRAGRRRVKALAPPTLPDPEVVRTVELRRREYIKRGDDRGDEHEAVDWSCQWVVRPHWRAQWYPSEHRHKSILIGAYTKGPADKPLKAVTPLFVVKR